MGDQGEVVAVEKLAPRARTMSRGIERLGLRSIAVEVADGTEAPLESFGRGGPYDRAIVDAPCSGLGVLARRADARWRKEAARLADSAELQGRLLRAAARVVRPGGVLVYSVCSFEPEETDEVIASFLAGNDEWQVEDASAFLPPEIVEEGGAMRMLPHRHGTDGAYAVRMRRRGTR
jgi:16S rRNA (cytosine967-C5)-methyltransferase